MGKWAPAQAWGARPVGPSADLDRVLALPRRAPPTDAEQADMAATMTALLRRDNPNCKCAELNPALVAKGKNPCITELFPIQGWYLWEAMHGGGVLAFAAAGAGKTGIDCLLPMVVPEAKTCALLIPPSLRAQFAHDFKCWSQHFRTPNLAGTDGAEFVAGRPVLQVIAYSMLSRASCAQWFQEKKPNVVIADEAQNLANLDAAVTSRFFRYLTEVDFPVWVFEHSGSLTTDGLDDYYHLAALALHDRSPLPLDPNTAEIWAGAIDPERQPGSRTPAGALKQLCDPGEPLTSGFRRRLIDTLGVITTGDAAISTRLQILKRDPGPIPDTLKDLLRKARNGSRPDDVDLEEAIDRAMCVSQLTAGFYYYWRFPRGEPAPLIEEWFAKRKAYNKELSDALAHRSHWLDSPDMLRKAGERCLAGYKGELPVWRTRTLAAWAEIEDKVQPVPACDWLDDYLAADAVRWGKERAGIIWYDHDAWGKRVAELGGFPLYGGGSRASVEIAKEHGTRTIVASVAAHGTGKNLESFDCALVGNPTPSGWEQLLARLHRNRQASPIVRFWVYQHTPEFVKTLETAVTLSRYVQETTGKKERLLFAEWVDGEPGAK